MPVALIEIVTRKKSLNARTKSRLFSLYMKRRRREGRKGTGLRDGENRCHFNMK